MNPRYYRKFRSQRSNLTTTCDYKLERSAGVWNGAYQGGALVHSRTVTKKDDVANATAENCRHNGRQHGLGNTAHTRVTGKMVIDAAAGEHFVMSQLLRENLIAALAPVGVPTATLRGAISFDRLKAVLRPNR